MTFAPSWIEIGVGAVLAALVAYAFWVALKPRRTEHSSTENIAVADPAEAASSLGRLRSNGDSGDGAGVGGNGGGGGGDGSGGH